MFQKRTGVGANYNSTAVTGEFLFFLGMHIGGRQKENNAKNNAGHSFNSEFLK
jgi:hypothetical protein